MLGGGQSSAEFTGLHLGRRRSPTTTKRARRAADLAFLRVASFDCSALALSGPTGRRTRRDDRCLCTPRGHGVQAAPRAPGGRPRRGEASYQVLRRSIGRGRSIRSRIGLPAVPEVALQAAAAHRAAAGDGRRRVRPWPVDARRRVALRAGRARVTASRGGQRTCSSDPSARSAGARR
jgi:hypothetical protein